MALEPVGFKAIIEGFSSYMEQATAMRDESNKFTAAQAAEAAQSAKTADAAVKVAQAHATQAKDLQSAQTAWNELNTATKNASAAHLAAATAAQTADSAQTHLTSTVKGLILAAGTLLTTYAGYRTLHDIVLQTDQLAEATLKLQRATGLTAPQASALIYTFEKLGLSTENVGKQFTFFSRNMTQVQETEEGFTGLQKTTSEVLQAMGITVLDSAGKLLPFDDILAKVADRFASMPDGIEKSGLAVQLFGRSGTELLPFLNQGSAGLAALRAEAEKLGLVLNEDDVTSAHAYTNAMHDFEGALKGLQVEIGLEVMPVLTDFAKWFTDHQSEVHDFIQTFIKDAGEVGGDLLSGFQQLNKLLSWIPDNQGEVVAAIVAIGVAFAWAMPGGPLLLGLGLIIAGLGKLSQGMSGQEQLGATEAKNPGDRDKTIGLLQAGGQSKAAATKQYDEALADYNAYLQKKADADAAAEKKVADAAIDADNALKKTGAGIAAIPPKVDAVATAITAAAKAFESSGLISLADSIELKLTPAMAGAVEGVDYLIRAQQKADEVAFTYSKTIAKVGEVMGQSTTEAERLVTGIAEQAFASAQKAMAAAFARPTQEEATLELSLARVSLLYDQAQATVDAARVGLEAEKSQLQKQINAGPGGAPASATGVSDAASVRVVAAAQQRATQALTDQMAALDKQIADLKNPYEQQKAAIEQSLKLEGDRTAILKAQAVSADKTLLTDAEQRKVVGELTTDIGVTSKAIRDLKDATGDELLPEVKTARDDFNLFNGALATLTDKSLPTLISHTDAAAERMDLLVKAGNEAAIALMKAAAAASLMGAVAVSVYDQVHILGGGFGDPGLDAFRGFGGNVPGSSEGRYVTRPVISWLGEGGQKEVVLPLEKPARAQQILATVPPSLLAPIMGMRGTSPHSIFGDLSVQGYTLEDMEATVHRTVTQAFSTARQASSRTGALLPQSIGPGGY